MGTDARERNIMRRIYELRRYGLPETLLDIWVQQQGEFLLPVQEAAVQRYGLFDGRSLVISSPTSSGKTFVGEMAAMRAAFAGKRVLYLTPLRALAEEKFRTFRERYGAYGIKVVVATRDRREFDRDIEQGDFHLAVLVYEKLAQLLVRQPYLLRTVALVVVDELQMIGDPDRGPGLELSLAKLLGSVPRPQILGLSAVLREAQEIAQWLQAELLFHEDRPVELYQGVLQKGRFRYKAYNTGDTGEECLAAIPSTDPRKILSANVKYLVERGEQVLIFLKSKRDTINCALALADELALPPAHEALQALDSLEETVLKAQLRRAFAKGIAFHHADLTSEERAVVETHYRQGGLRAIACTTTLAFGVNLPASTVFLESTKWATDPRTGAALEVPLSWAEYENISGRAGRLGFHESGRSILIAINQFQADWLWRSYILGEYEQLRPAPGQKGLVDRVLNLIASKVCLTVEELQAFFALTYLGFQHGGKTEALVGELEKILAALVRGQLISMSDDGRLEATTLGEVSARKGLQAATAVKLARFFAGVGSREIPELELLYLLNLTADGKRVYVPLSSMEHRGRQYEQQMSQALPDPNGEVGEEFHQLLHTKMLPTAQEVRAAKLALLALSWIAGEEMTELERHYQCYAGTIKTQMEHLSWLADAAAEIAAIMGWAPAQRLKELAEHFGVSATGFAVAHAAEGPANTRQNPEQSERNNFSVDA